MRRAERSTTPTHEAGQVQGVAGAVLGDLAAHEGAAGLAAPFGDAGHDLLDDGRVEPADADVVEEEQRIGALHGDVVDAHGDEVDADGVEATGGLRHLQLRADAVGRADQDRLAVAGGKRHEAAEAADVRQHLGPVRRADVAGEAGDGLVGGVEVDAGSGVTAGSGRSPPLSHGPRARPCAA